MADDASTINGGFLTFAEAICTVADPLSGELRLSTDQGEIVLSINRQTAALLADELSTFLKSEIDEE